MASPNSSNIMLGRADIKVANSGSFIDVTGEALDSSHSLGQTKDCTLNNVREFEIIRNFDSPVPIGRYLVDFGVSLAASILNADVDILNYLFGNDPSDLDDEIRFSVDKLSSDNILKWRVEAEFVYPNKEDRMLIILPKTTLINPSSLSLVNMDSPDNISFEFDQEEVSTWKNTEFGKILFTKT